MSLSNTDIGDLSKNAHPRGVHFSKFAIVSATDTTPPNSPTNISATSGESKATLSWTSPTDADYNGVNIYRSTTSGQAGTRVHSAVSGTSKDDIGLTNGTTYYYTIKAGDKSGNESSNTAQVSAVPGSGLTTTSTLPKTGASPTENSFSWAIMLILLGLMFSKRFTTQ